MYGHPYEPYDVQREFMAALYAGLSSEDVGIFESPTGTGKTFSLLCPSLAWLRNAAERGLQEQLARIDAGGGPAWVRDAAKKMRIDEFQSKKRKAEPETATKLYFVSRTHSQLAQVAEALQQLRVVPKPRFVTLGSRKQLCIHPDVRRLGSTEQMNEKCAELVKTQSCAFKTNLEPLTTQINSKIMDIEDLARAGRAEHACSYYAAREAVPEAEIVAIPYPLLLVESNREALGIDLHDSVVIVDEAHNLVDTLTGLHSATLGPAAVTRAGHGLAVYLQRVGARMGPDTKRKIMQIERLVASVGHYLETAKGTKPGTPLNASDLLAHGNAHTLDLVGLHTFAKETHLVFKVESYSRTFDREGAPGESEKRKDEAGPTNALGILLNFMLTATNPTYSGRLYHDVVDGQLTLRYLALDPAPLFADIVNDAKCVVLAGGTMAPMSEFTTYLLPKDARIGQHSYGHIVPRKQLLVTPMGDTKFTFANRGSPETIAGLGSMLLNIVRTTPNGVVAFFPGYGYLAQVVSAWQKSGVWAQLKQVKRVFYETRGPSDVFAEYARHVSKGALLLAVVGGRLSEGINFSNELARGVVMIGLPFPNAMSAEMVAKRRFIEQSTLDRGGTADQAKEDARQYYENLAMRAVNQSVGRAIRHADDFAAIFLVDARYKLPEVQAKLSKWVRDSIEEVTEEKLKQFWRSNIK